MVVEPSRESLDFVNGKLGLLGLILEEASSNGGLLRAETTDMGIYLARDERGGVIESYEYSGSISVSATLAIIELSLRGHDTISKVRAEVMEGGNDGVVMVSYNDGGVGVDAW